MRCNLIEKLFEVFVMHAMSNTCSINGSYFRDERNLTSVLWKYYKEQYDPINERRNVYSKVIQDRALSTNFFLSDIRCIFASISHVDTTHQMISDIRIRKCLARDLHSGCGEKIVWTVTSFCLDSLWANFIRIYHEKQAHVKFFLYKFSKLILIVSEIVVWNLLYIKLNKKS